MNPIKKFLVFWSPVTLPISLIFCITALTGCKDTDPREAVVMENGMIETTDGIRWRVLYPLGTEGEQIIVLPFQVIGGRSYEVCDSWPTPLGPTKYRHNCIDKRYHAKAARAVARREEGK